MRNRDWLLSWESVKILEGYSTSPHKAINVSSNCSPMGVQCLTNRGCRGRLKPANQALRVSSLRLFFSPLLDRADTCNVTENRTCLWRGGGKASKGKGGGIK